MNADEMPAGPELDAAVAAQVMGWEDDPADYPYAEGSLGNLAAAVAMSKRPPPYSTDIAPAWQVVEHLSPERTALRMHLYQIDDGRWHCHFSTTFDDDADAWGETAPLAICRAALKTAARLPGLRREKRPGS